MTEGRGNMTMEFDPLLAANVPPESGRLHLDFVRAVARTLSSKKPGLRAERGVSYDVVPTNVAADIIASRK